MSWINAAITGGAALVGTAGNLFSSSRLNKRAENFNKWMYRHQRVDALADRDFALEYQSPQAQMQRLKDAGLNPNLMYGSGVHSQAAPDVRGSSMSAPNYKMPELDFGGVAQAALQGMQARANISLTEAQAEKVRTETATGKFDLAVKQGVGLDELQDNMLKRLQSEGARFRKEYAEAEATLSAMFTDKDGKMVNIYDPTGNFRRVLEAGYAAVHEKLKNLREDGNIKEAIKTVKQFEANMARNGIPPNSPWYVKALMELFESFGSSAARRLFMGGE